MKRIALILGIVFAFTSTLHAQKGHRKGGNESFTVTQKTNLLVKKMTLRLNLTKSQQAKIKPIIAQQVADRKAMRQKMKSAKKGSKKPTSDQRYAMQNNRLDKHISFKRQLKKVLTDKQYSKFEKQSQRKMGKLKKRQNKKKRRMHRKHS